MAQLLQDPVFASAPKGALFGPSRGDIDAVNGIGELARHGVSAVGHCVGFEEAGASLIPLVAGNGDLLAKQRARLGRGSAPLAVLDAYRFEQSIDGGRCDFEHTSVDFLRQGAIDLLVAGQPQRQNRLQALGAGQVGGQPDGLQRLQDRFALVARLRAPFLGRGSRETSVAS